MKNAPPPHLLLFCFAIIFSFAPPTSAATHHRGGGGSVGGVIDFSDGKALHYDYNDTRYCTLIPDEGLKATCTNTEGCSSEDMEGACAKILSMMIE